MRIAIVTLFLLLVHNASAFADCSKSEICSMLGKMGHFDILNKCPGPKTPSLLAECKKVSNVTITELPAPDFIDNKDGTISDVKNNLLWSKTGVMKKGRLVKTSLKDARRVALAAEIAGKSGWRLPTLAELKTLIYKERTANTSGKKAWINPVFDDGRGHYYWSTTTCSEVSYVIDGKYGKKICQQGDQAVWLVHFNINAIFWHHSKAENYHVWLVQELK